MFLIKTQSEPSLQLQHEAMFFVAQRRVKIRAGLKDSLAAGQPAMDSLGMCSGEWAQNFRVHIFVADRLQLVAPVVFDLLQFEIHLLFTTHPAVMVNRRARVRRSRVT